jgi:hypothetical protein
MNANERESGAAQLSRWYARYALENVRIESGRWFICGYSRLLAFIRGGSVLRVGRNNVSIHLILESKAGHFGEVARVAG